ncbi:MAG: hypothetical protein GXO71_03255 [Caldiserica bacterium]|nr:hypothetical protein [Caldisericota bacterium]
MKQWILKSIGVASTFKMVGGTTLIFSLITGLVISLVSPEEMFLPLMGTIPSGIVGALLFAAFYGFFTGLSAAVLVAIYNIFALLFGGITLKIEEKD